MLYQLVSFLSDGENVLCELELRTGYIIQFCSGLKIITTLLGGGPTSDGIDKVDNGGGGSPMQVLEELLPKFLLLLLL